MPEATDLLKVLEPGEVTVVSFVNQPYLGATTVKAFVAEMNEIIRVHQPVVIEFDLTGVALMSSDMIGCLLALRNNGVDVALYNPSEDVCQTMETSDLITMFDLIDERE